MANIMNLEDGGSDYKPEAEWRLYFDDFKKFYGDKERYERMILMKMILILQM